MTTLAYSGGVPTPGSTLNSLADPELVSALNAILTWANGNIDAVNLTALAAQAAGVNQSGQTVKGQSNNAGPGTRTNTAYGALSDAADQVTGIVLPTNGLIAVWFQGTWQESVAGTARAAIFIGANQAMIQGSTATTRGPLTQAAATNAGVAARNTPLFSAPTGLASVNASAAYAADVTTGQIVGFDSSSGDQAEQELQGTGVTSSNFGAGPCYIFAAAGTYSIGVQYKSSSGTVTASNRKLWCQALSFS